MCFSSPDIKRPEAPQDRKAPDFSDIAKARKKNEGMGSGSLLTGPSGVSLQSQNFGSNTLLGG